MAGGAGSPRGSGDLHVGLAPQVCLLWKSLCLFNLPRSLGRCAQLPSPALEFSHPELRCSHALSVASHPPLCNSSPQTSSRKGTQLPSHRAVGRKPSLVRLGPLRRVAQGVSQAEVSSGSSGKTYFHTLRLLAECGPLRLWNCPDHRLVAPREHPHLPGRSSSDALSDSLP